MQRLKWVDAWLAGKSGGIFNARCILTQNDRLAAAAERRARIISRHDRQKEDFYETI